MFLILPSVTEGAIHIENGVAHANVCSGSAVGVFCGGGEFYTDVSFAEPFGALPTVFVTPNHMTDSYLGDGGECVGSSMDALLCHAEKVTRSGFRLYCSGSPQGSYCGAYGAWWAKASAHWIALDTDDSVQSGHGIMPTGCAGSNVGSLCSTVWHTDITFQTPFNSVPHVLVSPEHVSAQGGCVGGSTDAVICYPSNVTLSGFRLSCGGSPAWSACGDYGGYISLAKAGWLAKESTPNTEVQSGHGIETTLCDGSIYPTGVCYGNHYRDVTFPKSFTNTPRVIVSPEHVSTGPACAGGGTDALLCEARNVTTTGFRAVCWGSPQYEECGYPDESGTTRATFGYMAIAESGKPSCSIVLDENPIAQGESTTISWTSTNAALFYLNSIGYVGASGSATVSPSHTTDFSGYVSNSATGGEASYCPATLRVNQLVVECPPGTHLVNGVCVTDLPDEPSDDDTPDDTPDDDTTDPPSNCAIGYEYTNGYCVFVSCPVGYVKQGNACVFQGCPVGYTLQNGVCIWTGCPDGFIPQGQQCVLENQCTSLPYCQGDDLFNGCTHERIQVCQYGCANGVCKGVPSPTAALSASPSLVKKGQTTKLSWNSKNTAGCVVTGSNGDSFSALTATNQVSGPINSTTIFTLHCDGYEGSSPASVTKSVTVSVRADYEEK